VFSSDVIKSFDKAKTYYSTVHLHNDMRRFPDNRAYVPDDESWDKENIFYKRHTGNPDSPFYIDESDIIVPIGPVIDMIRQAGGKVFIPHIYQYDDSSMKVLYGLIDNYEIDGIECFYPSFTREQTDHLIDLCQSPGFLLSAGRDYHGANPPQIELGMDDRGLCSL